PLPPNNGGTDTAPPRAASPPPEGFLPRKRNPATTTRRVQADEQRGTMPELLLFSNSTNHGRGYLDHGWDDVEAFLGGRDRVAFVPCAGGDHAAYTRSEERRVGKGWR